MKRFFAVGLMLSIILVVQAKIATPYTQKSSPAQLSGEDVTLIAEAYHLQKSLGGRLWMGWAETQIPILYVTRDFEYALGFPENAKGFQSLNSNDILPGVKIQVRQRVLEPTLAAARDVDGVNAVVIGSPANLGKSPSRWVLIAVHEMFHVWQFSKGSTAKVRELNIGSPSDASWQVNFPFPYNNADLMRLIHLQSYLIYLAATNVELSDAKYNAGTALEAVEVYRNVLKQLDASDQFYKYSKFQEWDEGIAFYTEYKLAELAASADYQPSAAFRQLDGFQSYRQLWDDTYKNRIFLAKHAGRIARSRTTFYQLGLGKGLLLDRLMPDWKSRYFASGIWLDDLLTEALSKSE